MGLPKEFTPRGRQHAIVSASFSEDRAMRIIIGIGAAALLAACAKTTPASGPATASGPEAEKSGPATTAQGTPDFEALGAREASGLSEHRVTGPNKSFTATVRAAAPPKVSVEGKVAIVEIPIGSGDPIRCQVVNDALDAGGTVAGILTNASKKVQFAKVAPWAIEAVKEIPTTFVHALYTTQSPKGKAAGELKLAVHAPADRPIICVHDEFGYEKTFLESAKAFCDSIEYPDKVVAPSYAELQIARINGAPVGFSKTTIAVEGAKRRYTDVTTLLLPALANELQVEDNYSVEVVDQDLRLDTGAWVTASSGHIDLNVQVKRVKGGSYHYGGEFQGKKIDGDFKTKDGKGLPSSLSIARELSGRGKGSAPFSFEAASYHPSVDPTTPMVTKYFRERGDAESSVRQQMGKTTMTGILDELGVLKKGEMPIGGASLTLERTFVRGKF